MKEKKIHTNGPNDARHIIWACFVVTVRTWHLADTKSKPERETDMKSRSWSE